jgi:dipeptidase D
VVETSLNVGVVTMTERQRADSLPDSLADRQRQRLCRQHAGFSGQTGGAKTEAKGAYPGWQPDANSPVMHLVRETYQRLFNKTPNIQIIHAGWNAVCSKTVSGHGHGSIGPTITGPHSPDEQVHIESVGQYWTLLTELLKSIPAK